MQSPVSLRMILAFGLMLGPMAVQAIVLDEVDLRYRMEWVDQEGIDKDALASTARLRLSLSVPERQGFDAGISLQANRVIGNRLYNDTTGPAHRPVVADPADTGLSQAWLRYRYQDSLEARAGRQRLIDDNARFIGNVGFRQLEQTFDALSLAWSPNARWDLDLQYLDRVHRVFGPNHPDPLMAEADLDSWVAVLSRHWGDTRLGVYAHRFEFEDRPASHQNLGLRLTGLLPGTTDFSYRLEFARQSGLADQGPEADQDYWHLALARQHEGWRWFVGHERLGGDGQDSFQTPFATLHAHNGWADRFLSTPATGLRDSWLGMATAAGGWQLTARLHDFRADRGGDRFGRELNLAASRNLTGPVAKPWATPWMTELKLAWFDGDEGLADVTKLWWTLSASW